VLFVGRSCVDQQKELPIFQSDGRVGTCSLGRVAGTGGGSGNARVFFVYSQGSDHRALLAYLPVLLGVVWTFDTATQMRMFIFGFLIETLVTYPGVARLSTYVPVEVRSRGTVTHTTPIRAGKCTTCPLGLYGVIK